MSIELTESFMMFKRGTYAMATNANGLSLLTSPLSWATGSWAAYGYNNYNAGFSSYLNIVTDPVFPTRNRLAMGGSCNTYYVAHTLVRRAVSYTGVRRLGFLLRMVSGSLQTQFSVDTGITTSYSNPSHPVDTSCYPLVSFFKAASSTVLNISHAGTGAAIALSYTLKADTDYYVEVEINTSAGTYRVWVDDYLIIDAAMAAAAKTAYTAALGFRAKNFGDCIAAYLSDMYLLKDDGVAPNTRLGKNTRVKGELPTADVRTDFSRPSSYTSNWSVADNQVASAATPTDYLTAGAVGARDLYTSGTDSSYANVIHGVTVKAISANFSSQSSVVSAVLHDGTNAAVATLATLAAGAGFTALDAKFTTGPGGAALTPSSVAAMAFGMEVTS